MKFYYLGGVVDTIYIQLKMKLWIKKPINVYWKFFMFKRLEQLMFAQLILFLRNNNIVIFQSYKLSPSHIYDCNIKLLSLSLSLSYIRGYIVQYWCRDKEGDGDGTRFTSGSPGEHFKGEESRVLAMLNDEYLKYIGSQSQFEEH